MPEFTIRPLSLETYADFDALAARHNGIFGGCWCLSFHPEATLRLSSAERRAAKEARVRAGTARAALVYDGGACVGWCQFGSPEELPHIKNRKNYESGLAPPAPPWRITCFFADRHHRRQGVATAALQGAIDLIAGFGGGTVEAYPEAIAHQTSPSFIYSGTLEMFERAGFKTGRQIGKNKWVVTKEIAAA